MSDAPVVLVVESDPDIVDRHADWLAADYTVRTAIDGKTALDRFDPAVDVVLTDRQLPDMSGGGLLGRLRVREGDPAVGMFVGREPDYRVRKLAVDEFVIRPLDRETLCALVDRLDRHQAVSHAVSDYLSLLDSRRAFETDADPDALEDDPDYRLLTGELVARRQQFLSLFDRLDGRDVDDTGDPETTDETDEPTVPGDSDWAPGMEPIYYRRPREFYGLWLLAGLTYGVGDIISTLYAVFGVAGIEEANPVVDILLANFGVPGFLLLKLLVFLVLISVSVQGAHTSERFSYYWPPLLATVLGTALTLWNISLIAGAGGGPL